VKSQERIFEEVNEVVARHDGRIDHDTIAETEYLEAAINETLRIMCPITNQFKICSKDCEVRTEQQLPDLAVRWRSKQLHDWPSDGVQSSFVTCRQMATMAVKLTE
jgi:hypothetical protein